MFGRRRKSTPSALLLSLAVAVILFALPPATTACQDLNPDASDTTASVTTTTEVGSGTTMTTEAGGSSGGAGASGDAGGDDGDGAAGGSTPPSLLGTAYLLTTTTRIPTSWSYRVEDDGRHVTVNRGDSLYVALYFTPEDEVTHVTFSSTAPSIVSLEPRLLNRDPSTLLFRFVSVDGTAQAVGDAGIVVLSRHADGSVFDMWQLYVAVE